MILQTYSLPQLFSSDDNTYKEKGMIDRIISRTDAITAKELGFTTVQEMDEGKAPKPQKKRRLIPKINPVDE